MRLLRRKKKGFNVANKNIVVMLNPFIVFNFISTHDTNNVHTI